MKPPSGFDAEVSRIVAAYDDRERVLPADRYSLFDPENLLRVQELEREILRLFLRLEIVPLHNKSILEVGCGSGFWFREFLQWGAQPENLAGVDLLPARISSAKALSPAGVHLDCRNATTMDFGDATFDLVLQFTVFTSILDRQMKKALAMEMLRVLRPGGFIVWYDFCYDNPRNADVRGIARSEIAALFRGCRLTFRRVTVAPPLGRVVAPLSPLLYHLLSRCRIFCTHCLCLMEKPQP